MSMIIARARPHVVADARVWDAAVAAGLCALSQAQLPRHEAIWVRLSLLVILALAVRRRWPLQVTLVLSAGLALQGLASEPPANFGLYLAVMLASFTVAAECSIAPAVLGGAALMAGIAAHDVNSAEYGSAAGLASDLAIPVILWGVGRGVRLQRRRVDQAGELLARLEADQEELASLAVAAERAHLARELHDVVTHSVSVVVIQAQGARRALTGEQPIVSQSLEAIETAGRSALTEMRRLLGVLREEEAASETARPPGLGDLPALLQLVSGAGLTAVLTETGTPRRLDPAVELTAYRIVQESLTNALRYTAPGTASVSLAWSDGDLALEVVDSGGVAASDVFPESGGRGLLGLRERVAALGGELWSGPTTDHGHRVAARLPVRPA